MKVINGCPLFISWIIGSWLTGNNSMMCPSIVTFSFLVRCSFQSIMWVLDSFAFYCYGIPGRHYLCLTHAVCKELDYNSSSLIQIITAWKMWPNNHE
uniref:Uncharacterized protein n=1 Tax=Rhizophora mucronata TaxID=61149 RepID=A0A2P2NIS1_RHIMU